MRLAEQYLKMSEEFDATTEKAIANKGFYWGKGSEKFPITHLKSGTWSVSKDSDYEDQIFISKVIKTKLDDIRKVDTFYMGCFGDNDKLQNYEYGAISTSMKEIYEVMREYDIQQGVLGVFSKKEEEVKYIEIYPFSDGH